MESKRFTTDIHCIKCAQIGAAIWEEGRDPLGLATAGRAKLISVSSGFHREDGLTILGDPIIVCDLCESVVPD